MKFPALTLRWLVCLTPALLLLLLDVEISGSWADRFFPILRHEQEVLQRGDWAAQDALWRLRPVSPPHPDLVYVAIDNTSLKLDQFGPEEIAASPELSLMQKGWPWHRSVYASVIERLLAAGAKAVVLDLLFLNPNPGDAHCARRWIGIRTKS
jgi:CHASE2 domain-containing sensor protein